MVVQKEKRRTTWKPGSPKSEKPEVPLCLLRPQDLALLLKSTEQSVVLQCLHLLYESVLKMPETWRELLSGLLEDVFVLPPHPHPMYPTARYRFLAKVYAAFPDKRGLFRGREDLLRLAMDNALSTVDTSLRAYALQYVGLLTKDQPAILQEFVKTHEMSKLFVFLMDPDVDVQHNSMLVLKNLLSEAVEVRALANYGGLLSAAASPYPALQNLSLDLVLLLVSLPGEDLPSARAEFVNTGGLDLLFAILFIFHWRDLHPKCLKILWHLGETLPLILNMDHINGLSRLVQYITFILDDELQELDLDVIIKVAKFADARLIISRSGAMPVLKDLLQTASEQTKLKAVEALRLLALPPSDITQLSINDPVLNLLDILSDKENSKQLRCGTAKTLASIAKEVPVCVLTLSKKKNFEILKRILKDEQSDTEYMLEILKAMSTVLAYPTHLRGLLSRELIQTLLSLLQSNYTELHAPALHILSLTLSREHGRYLFANLRGVMDVMKILYMAKDKETIEMAGNFLKAAFKDPFLTDIFIRVGISSWFKSRQPAWVDSDGMRDAFSVLLTNNLSLKFELEERLELWELTRDGFYVCRFPIDPREDLILFCPDYRGMDGHTNRPIYYLNMDIESTQALHKEDSTSLIQLKNSSEDMVIKTDSQPGEIEEYRKQSEVPPPKDERLLKIHKKLLQDITQNEIASKWRGADRLRREWIEEMAKLLGVAVAQAMGGQSSNMPCTNHTLELHIKELMEKFYSNQIPLGALEVGLKLERAVLFKVLADQVGLPCALARGDYATGWVELAVPELSGRQTFKTLPLRELRPNFLVDLMDCPGRLLPLQSALAFQYQGRPNFLGPLAHRLEKLKLSKRTEDHSKTKQQFHIEID